MPNLFLTLMIAFIVIVIAIACLAIGWLITGKTKIERGACGRDPTQKRESCDTKFTCDLCEPPHLKDNQEIDQPKEGEVDTKEEGDTRYS